MLEAIVVSLGFGFVIGGCVIAVVMALLVEFRRDTVLRWGRALKGWWHEWWAEHHERILLKLDEDGGLSGQYFSEEYTYHYGRHEYYLGKVWDEGHAKSE